MSNQSYDKLLNLSKNPLLLTEGDYEIDDNTGIDTCRAGCG